MTKKILILMSSPRKSSNTNELCRAFSEGASSAGHLVSQINLASLKLNPCLACDYCGSHEGKCVQRDDMHQIYEAFDWCDVIVLASPLYYYTINAQLKTVIDRLYASGLHKGFQYAPKESVLIMTSGEDSADIFDQPQRYYHLLREKIFPWKHRGEILVGGFSARKTIEDHSVLDSAFALGNSI